ncbi:hypothetical protein TWF481_002944 [Arthrobotrys musiformis]|uniref:Uncharacterized protein n=1 Tax=Arthrobotrys musiformis TaxID=47236 RepID=A0AAV9VTW4_9PEZI
MAASARRVGLDRIDKPNCFAAWAKYAGCDVTGLMNQKVCGQLVLAAVRIKQIANTDNVYATLGIDFTNAANINDKMRMIKPFVTTQEVVMADKVLLECLPGPVIGATLAGYAERVAVNAGYNADAPQYHGNPPEACAYYIKWIELDIICDQLTTYELVRNFKEMYRHVASATPPKWVKIGHTRAPPTAPPDDAPRDAKLLWLANIESCYMDTIIADILVAIYDPLVEARDVFMIETPNWFKDICVSLTAAQLVTTN